VWSAACATGEEPLTLAMLLDDRKLLGDVEIIATDISDAAIHRAKSGLHSRRSVRPGHPADLAARYLDQTAAGVASTPRLRDAIQFRTGNLFDEAAVEQLGSFDAILCRNVLIYFSDASVVRVIERLRRSLARGGVIAIGVSESLLRFGTSLLCEEHAGSFFYRSAR
jgi:chemotaxis protein methyltransferase CheR